MNRLYCRPPGEGRAEWLIFGGLQLAVVLALGNLVCALVGVLESREQIARELAPPRAVWVEVAPDPASLQSQSNLSRAGGQGQPASLSSPAAPRDPAPDKCPAGPENSHPG